MTERVEIMWIPEQSKLEESDAPLIVSDYVVLLGDDITPILFVGVNSKGQHIIGSSVEDERATETFLHAVVSEETFTAFGARRTCYPQVLRDALGLFFLKQTGSEVPEVYRITFDDIPDGYRPSEKAFCPAGVELETTLTVGPANPIAPRDNI